MPQPVPLPDPLRRRVAALVQSDGERLAIARLGIGRQTLARALAGLRLATGTLALVRQRLDAVEAEDARRRWRP